MQPSLAYANVTWIACLVAVISTAGSLAWTLQFYLFHPHYDADDFCTKLIVIVKSVIDVFDTEVRATPTNLHQDAVSGHVGGMPAGHADASDRVRGSL